MALNALLLGLVALPAVAGALLLALDRGLRAAARPDGLPAWLGAGIATATTLATLVAAGWLAASFDPTNTAMQFVFRFAWIPDWGVSAFFGLDGFGLWFLLSTSFVVFALVLSEAIRGAARPASWWASLLILQTGMLGAFASLNLVLFAFFWELAIVPLAFLVGVFGREGRVRAVFRLAGFAGVGSLLLWFAIASLAVLQHDALGASNLDWIAGPGTAVAPLRDLVIPAEGAWWRSQHGLFLAFLIAFAVRIPWVPFHPWLTALQDEAPRVVAPLAAGVFLGLGVFAALRFALPLFPDAAIAIAPGALAVAMLGALYAAALALTELDLKRLVASLSVLQLSIASVGLFALNAEGLTGSTFLVLSHGVGIAAFGVLVAALEARRETTEIAAFGGIARPMPSFAALLTLTLLVCIGTPLTGAFVGVFLSLLGAFHARPLAAGTAVVALVVGAIACFRILRALCYGPVESPENRGLIDLGWRERGIVLLLLAPLLWAGVDPQGVLRPLQPSVLELLRTMEERSDGRSLALRARPPGASRP